MSSLGPPGPNSHGLNFNQANLRRNPAFPPPHPTQPGKQSPASHNASPYQSQYAPQQSPQYPQHLFGGHQLNGNVNGNSRAPNSHGHNALGAPRQRAAPPRQQMPQPQAQQNPSPMLFPGSMSQSVQHDSIMAHQQQQHQQHQGHPSHSHPGHQPHQGHQQHHPQHQTLPGHQPLQAHQSQAQPPQQQQPPPHQQQHPQQRQQHQMQHQHHPQQQQPQQQQQPPQPQHLGHQPQPQHQHQTQTPTQQHRQQQQQQSQPQLPHQAQHQPKQNQHQQQQPLPPAPPQQQPQQQQQQQPPPQQQQQQQPQLPQAQVQSQASMQAQPPPQPKSRGHHTPQQKQQQIPTPAPPATQAPPPEPIAQQEHSMVDEMDVDGNPEGDTEPMGEMMSAPPEGGSYPTLEAVQKAVLRYCTSVGYAIVIGRSKKTVPGLKKVLFVCDRAGKPPNRVSPEFRKRKTSSRKCDCPFGFFAIEQRTQWTIRYRPDRAHLVHNHGPSEGPSHHPAARKLDSKMVAAVKQLKESGTSTSSSSNDLTSPSVGAGVSETLAILQNDNPDCHLLPRDIYNARAAINRNPTKVNSGLAEDRPTIYTKPPQTSEDRIRSDLRRELSKAKEDLQKLEEEKKKEIDELKEKLAEKDKMIQRFEMFIDICNERVMVQRERLSGPGDSQGNQS